MWICDSAPVRQQPKFGIGCLFNAAAVFDTSKKLLQGKLVCWELVVNDLNMCGYCQLLPFQTPRAAILR